jgi:hypothetical protein
VAALWRVERSANARFPFRIAIEQDGRPLFAVRAQSAWPAPGGQIFCLREREHDPAEALEPVETVPIAALSRVGAKLSVALDRPRRKRCEFLVLTKQRKDGTGPYEQVFFRTESAIRAHRSRGRVELRAGPELDVVIDVSERYPWRFPGARVARRPLAAGDYALVRGEEPIAVVERKTLPNLLQDIGALRALHQGLAQLASQPRAALVIEAQYADFLDAERVRPWPPAHLARVLAEIAALHPRLPIVYAGNRKLANHWALAWFGAVAADLAHTGPLFVSDVLARWDGPPPDGGLDRRIREAALLGLPSPFRVAELCARVPGAGPKRVARVLKALRREGRVRCAGRGPTAAWERIGGWEDSR